MFPREVFMIQRDAIYGDNLLLEIAIVFTIKHIRYMIWIMFVFMAIGSWLMSFGFEKNFWSRGINGI
jgi:hypothetical protein